MCGSGSSNRGSISIWGVGLGGRWEGGSRGRSCIPMADSCWGLKTTKFCKAIIFQLKNKVKKTQKPLTFQKIPTHQQTLLKNLFVFEARFINIMYEIRKTTKSSGTLNQKANSRESIKFSEQLNLTELHPFLLLNFIRIHRKFSAKVHLHLSYVK